MDSDNTRPENPVDNPPGLPKKGSENWDLSSDSELSSPPSSDESNNEMNANKKPAEKAMKAQKDIACKFYCLQIRRSTNIENSEKSSQESEQERFGSATTSQAHV